MPLELIVVLRFERSSFINAGTIKGKTENQITTKTIKKPIINFSNVRGRREIGVVKPIVTAKAKKMNRVRPAVIHENGGTKGSALLNLVSTIIVMSMNGTK